MTIQRLTEFGKFVRIARLEAGKQLKEMADAAGISSAYLSSIEMGRKEVSEKIVNAISNYLQFDEDKSNELWVAANISNGKIKLDIEGQTNEGARVATMFARHFADLTEEEMEKISDVLKNNSNGLKKEPINM